MKIRHWAQLRDRLHDLLANASIRQRLRYLFLLNAGGLILLLLLGVTSSVLKDLYFDSIEQLNSEQKQLRRFDAETARLQANIRQYLNSPDKDLVSEIDKATAALFLDLESLGGSNSAYSENFSVLRSSLSSFVTGYRELKQINAEIDLIYETQLLEPSTRSAELLALVIGGSAQSSGKSLFDPASQSLINAFVDSLLKMNAYYASRETNVSLSTRVSLERVATLAPVLLELAPGDIERDALRLLEARVNTMISGLGRLQRASSNRSQTMVHKIEASQQAIALAASELNRKYSDIEASLRERYNRQLVMVNVLSVLVGAVVVTLTFLFGALISRSIRQPLGELMRTVEAFSCGNFDHPIPQVGNNELGQLTGSLRDLRQSAIERVRAEDALRLSEERFRKLSDMSSDLFWEQDAEGCFTAFSGQRARQLVECGVLRTGTCLWDIPNVAMQPEALAIHREMVTNRRPFRDFELVFKQADGGLIYLQLNGDPVFDSQQHFTGYYGTAKDISAQKANEAEVMHLNQTLEQRVVERTTALQHSNEQLSQAMEQLVQSEKLASLGNLVAGVAHELNTPLGNALVAASSLRDHVSDIQKRVDGGGLRRSELAEFMRACEEGSRLIERNADRAATLVSNFKQVAVDQTSVKRREFDLLKTIQEVVATLVPGLRKQHHSITIDIPEGLRLNSYPGPLDQVVSNIVTNATVHAFKPGESGEIIISASQAGDHEVVLMLSDNGIGIDPEKQSRVFDPFFTTRLGQGGSGLGLYIVYNIVTNLLGGQIQLISAPGSGTCFYIHIPLVAPMTDDDAVNVHDTSATSTALDFHPLGQ